jgi:hypothetical protein
MGAVLGRWPRHGGAAALKQLREESRKLVSDVADDLMISTSSSRGWKTPRALRSLTERRTQGMPRSVAAGGPALTIRLSKG